MKEKIKYMPEEIFIGNRILNARWEGYMAYTTEAFIKVKGTEGCYYNRLKGIGMFPEYERNTPEYISVAIRVPLVDIIEEEKRNKPMSAKMIKLYVLKYRLKHRFTKDKSDRQKTR